MKHVILALAIIAALATNTFFDVVLHPSLSAELAAQQLTNSEVAAVTIRGYEHAANLLPVITWSLVGVLGLALYWRKK